MPLTVECIGSAQLPEHGIAMLYSLCHYYEQNGDLMQDPEMCFAVVDTRRERDDPNSVQVFPYMYRQANLGVYEESIRYSDEGTLGLINAKQQAEHKAFADHWLDNLMDQGFIRKLQPEKDNDPIAQ